MDTEVAGPSGEVRDKDKKVEMPSEDNLPPPELDVLPRAEFDLEAKPLGRGSFGIVYKGIHKDLGHVVVKTLVTKDILSKE